MRPENMAVALTAAILAVTFLLVALSSSVAFPRLEEIMPQIGITFLLLVCTVVGVFGFIKLIKDRP